MRTSFSCRDLPALPKGKGSLLATPTGRFAYFDHSDLTKKRSDRGLWSIMVLPSGALVLEREFRDELRAREVARLFETAYQEWWELPAVAERTDVALPRGTDLLHFRDWVDFFEHQLLEERDAYRAPVPDRERCLVALSDDELRERLKVLSARRRQV